MAKKMRLDQVLIERGLAETQAQAQALLMAGSVRVGGSLYRKPGDRVAPEIEISPVGALPYASRGGYKLAHALDQFGLSPAALVALDAGASTGGFTDVLLQRGAAHVYAVDVGYGLLDWRLRQDARVTVVERTNIRFLEHLPGTITIADCATIDVSFISLRLVLPAVQRLCRPDGWIIALIKPQFEAETAIVDKGAGVVRDQAVHGAVIRDIVAYAAGIGLTPHGLARSPITGPAGNVEFLAWLGGPGPELELEQAIQQIVG